MTRTRVSALIAWLACMSVPAVAFAQGDDSGGVGGSAGGSVGGEASTPGTDPAAGGEGTASPEIPPPPPPPPPAEAPPGPPTTAAPVQDPNANAEQKDDEGIPDHEKVVGHFAVGFHNFSQIPIAAGAPGGNGIVTRDTVTAPVIGIRYWLNRMIGIDGGLGFGMTTGSNTVENGGTSTSVDKPSRWAAAIHGGVPLALASGQHYTFEVIPEANFGFASGTISVANQSDQNLSGIRLDVGARAGAEVYFGFIGVPQLALQGTIGLYLRHENFKWSQDNNSASDATTTIATSVQSDPWALFTNNISALYYF